MDGKKVQKERILQEKKRKEKSKQSRKLFKKNSESQRSMFASSNISGFKGKDKNVNCKCNPAYYEREITFPTGKIITT